jgi:periplasmic protein TonB
VRDIRLPFALSLLGHAVLLVVLALFVTAAPPLPLPEATSGIAVTFAPSLPQPATPPAPPAPAQPPPPVQPPPPPPVALVEPPPLPPPPDVTTLEAPIIEPPPKPVVRPLRPVRPERPVPQRVFAPAPAAAAPQRSAQTAYARLPAPSTAISPSYQALLGAWLESHKRYPESAREHDEEGRAVLQFVVDRSGRVVDFAVITSSGYPDLDASVESMMRGATLPPFPPDMPQSSIRVSVAIRFSLD